MFDAVLFFGMELTPTLHDKLDRANPHAVKLFIDNQSTYLHRVNYGKKIFLGKFLDTVTTCGALEMVEANILSILNKLAPGHSEAEPMLLFATKRESSG